MALHFSNASRIYDLARHCVRFWGYSAFEITFYLNEEALSKISPYADRDEVFDVNRARIEKAASVAYSHSLQRQSYHRLSASDLLLEEIMARSDKHGNREAKKPKKVKPKEAMPVSTFASIQKKELEATNPKKK
ncbi:MAG TPA: DUF1488 family protein [Methylocella sp.]|jgi:hypothetical protein